MTQSTPSTQPSQASEPLPPFLTEPPTTGAGISVTGTWRPTRPSGRFRTTDETRRLLAGFERIRQLADAHPGVLATDIDRGVGVDAVMTHQVFADGPALVDFYAAVAEPLAALAEVAEPGSHMVRGLTVPSEARAALDAAGLPVQVGEWLYGYTRDDRRPDPATAVQVTATWACGPGGTIDELRYWWQRVGTDAHSIEEGLIRFEAYQVPGEDALIIHETFADSDELKFHLTKGTADRYKKDIDRIAAPENYYFRGPVAWLIRTYSKFMRLPATYARSRSGSAS